MVLVACHGSQRDRADLSAALKSCADAFGEIANSALPSDATAIYARGCHDLYREPECRQAVASLADISPDVRIAMLARHCANAYCGKLDAPAPRLCAPGPLPAADEIGPAWRELDERILTLEIGSDAPGIGRIAGAITREVTVQVPRSPPPEEPATDDIALTLAGDRVSIAVAGKTWKIGTAPTPAELAPIVAAVDKTHRVVLHVSKDLQYATVVAVLTALQHAGVTRVAMATD